MKEKVPAAATELQQENDRLRRRIEELERRVAASAAPERLEAIAQTERELKRSEFRFRALFEQAAVGMAHVDNDGMIVNANPSFCAMLHYEREELRGKRLTEISHRDDVSEDRRLFELLKEESIDSFTRETRFLRSDGEILWAHVSPTRIDGDADAGFVVVVVDVTEQLRTRDSLLFSQRQLELAMGAAKLGTWSWDIRTGVVDWSESLERLHAFAPGEFGRTFEAFTELVHPDDRAVIQRAIEEAVRDATEFHAVVRSIGRDGSIHWLESRGHVFFDESGPLGMRGVAVDITDRRKSELEAREHELRFRAAVEASFDAFYLFAAVRNASGDVVDFVFEDINERAAALVSMRRDELLGQSLVEKFPRSLINGQFDLYRRTLASQAPVEEEISPATPGVRSSWLRQQIVPVGSDCVAIISQDLSEQKQIERELRLSEAKFRALAESHMLGVILAKLDGAIVEANDAFLAMLGFTREDLESGRVRWDEMTPPECEESDRRALELLVAERVSPPWEKVYVGKNGRRVPVLIGAAVIEGKRDEVICFVIDLSESKRAEEERKRLLDRERLARSHAEAASRAKDQFLATVSHELRTPLTAILGWAQMLQLLPPDQAKTSEALAAIERNARSQAQLIDDILDVSRIITGKMRLELRPVSIEAVIETALQSITPAATAKGIVIEKQLDSVGALVSGDPDRLQQILWNLFSNAMKFTPRGGVVSVRLERAGEQVEISVADTGAGIDPAFLPHVFEAFRQADGSSTREHGGLGLGLAIVRHLAELHGGAVSATSGGRGKGATFTLTLPLEAATGERVPLFADSREVVSAANQRAAVDLSGVRLLIVDDEPDVREIVRGMLEPYGAVVATTGSCDEALAWLDQNGADVLVADIGMPQRDGYDLIRTVRTRESEAGAKLPAIALSAYARDEDRQRSLDRGFDDHLAKPIHHAHLAAAIAKVLATH